MSERMTQVQGDHAPAGLEVVPVVNDLQVKQYEYMLKEERILFPASGAMRTGSQAPRQFRHPDPLHGARIQ